MKKHYFKDVLPRLHAETEQWLKDTEQHSMIDQLPHLFITGRCSCGSCSDFHLDSDIPKLSKSEGSTLLHRPLYYDMDNGFMIGLSGADGLTEGEHSESYVSSFELCGGDYPDGYINQQLESIGLMQSKQETDNE